MTDANATRPEPIVRISKYLESLRGTHDEVFSRLIRLESRVQARTKASWDALLEEIKSRPMTGY